MNATVPGDAVRRQLSMREFFAPERLDREPPELCDVHRGLLEINL
jgi:hypothetical protein